MNVQQQHVILARAHPVERLGRVVRNIKVLNVGPARKHFGECRPRQRLVVDNQDVHAGSVALDELTILASGTADLVSAGTTRLAQATLSSLIEKSKLASSAYRCRSLAFTFGMPSPMPRSDWPA